MTNEELDRARAKEAQRLFLDGDGLAVVHAARLAREGWTPPVVVDPDLAEATILYNRHHASFEGLEETLFTAIKRGRELERAVMGNPIPEQIQEVKPPLVVDPDLLLARKIEAGRLGVPPTVSNAILHGAHDGDIEIERTLETIKRGRELERAEAKPGMVWVINRGLSTPDGAPILTRDEDGNFDIMRGCKFSGFGEEIIHYAIITQPEDK